MEDSVEISISLFFAMKDIPNLLADPANPKVSMIDTFYDYITQKLLPKIYSQK